MRSNLGRVRGLGASGDGVSHWWSQRITAIALVPLVLWFVISALSLLGASYDVFRSWLQNFSNALLLILLTIALFQHAYLGVQVILEDYVKTESLKTISIVVVKFIATVSGVATAMAIVKIAVSG